MTAVVIVGAQWGDEGKGKLADVLAPRAGVFVHYAGGGNPNQTIAVDGERLVFDVVPPAPMREGKSVLLAQGMALDPRMVVDELDTLTRHGVSGGEAKVCRRAHVVLPHHVLVDELRREAEGASGMPRRGIGPCYADKLARRSAQMGDLVSTARLTERVTESLEGWKSVIESLGGEAPTVNEIVDRYAALGDKLAPHLVDGSRFARDALAGEANVVFEAPLGTMVDLDLGAYPFVVSANTTAGGVAPGVGIAPQAIDHVIGVAKAYSTLSGRGPFPAELTGDLASFLQKNGEEYASSGRARRAGMLDLAGLRYAARVNGFDSLLLTKLDVLSGLDEIPVCMGYELDGGVLEEPPFDGLSRATPIVEMQKGWKEPVSECRTWEELPANARRYVELVESTTGVRVAMIGVGPDRSATIVREQIL